jgi:hypothetical protein
MANRAVTEWEFKNCIVEHNLTNKDGSPIDFRSPMALATLNPKVGNEIGDLIKELHDFEGDLPN